MTDPKQSTGSAPKNVPRGIQNNNPGNIRISAINYQGEVKPSTDKAFKQFVDIEHGYRAIFKDLEAKIAYTPLPSVKNPHPTPINTIRKIIEMYAPPEDGNDTEGYIRTVSSRTRIASDQIITKDVAVLRKIVSAISYQEEGIAADESKITAAIALL